MTDGSITALRFHDATGVEDWRVLFSGPHAHYRCAGLAEGARFVTAVATTAERVGVEPDVDLRPDGVTVRIRFGTVDRIVAREVALAQAVQVLAAEAGLQPDPTRLQVVNIAVAAAPEVDVRPFWTAVLGYERLGDEDAVDPGRTGPSLWFHAIRGGRTGRGRTHIDVSVPAEVAEARVAAAVAAGGRIADGSHAPDWWTLASPDNHGVDLAAWPDRNDD